MPITLDVIRRIERALRQYNMDEWEEIYLKKTSPGALTQTLQDRKNIQELYSDLKSSHSFGDSSRLAKIAWMCKLFGIEIDLSKENDFPPIYIGDPFVDKEDL